MEPAPRYKQMPCCLLIRGSLPCSDPIFPELDLSTELCGEITASFQSMRDLTQISNSGDQFKTILDRISFAKMRTNTVHRLLSVANQKPASEMANLDYHIETCRLAALIYIKLALHMYAPLCAITRGLKTQLMNLIEQGEANCTIGLGARQQPGSIRWYPLSQQTRGRVVRPAPGQGNRGFWSQDLGGNGKAFGRNLLARSAEHAYL